MISAALLLLAGLLYGHISYRNFHPDYMFGYDLFGFFGGLSWTRKYKWPRVPAPNNLYYRIFALKYREAFPLSATLLVWMTDWFHLFQAIMLNLIMAAVLLREPMLGLGLIWEFVIYSAAFRVGFNLGFGATGRIIKR